jgi:hypothetical protein
MLLFSSLLFNVFEVLKLPFIYSIIIMGCSISYYKKTNEDNETPKKLDNYNEYLDLLDEKESVQDGLIKPVYENGN